MGEFAEYLGERIKIGTCEEMYYLRFDQRLTVKAVEGSVNPVTDAHSIRFRFPFADEDHVEPGHFQPYDRGLAIPGYAVPADWLGDDEVPLDHPVEIVQQKLVHHEGSDQLWPVVRVSLVDQHSGKLYRLPPTEGIKVAEALADHASTLLGPIIDEGEPNEDAMHVRLLIQTAARILHGYFSPVMIVDELVGHALGSEHVDNEGNVVGPGYGGAIEG